MCFGENFDIFCLFEPLSHGNWNEEDTDARRDKKKVNASMCGLGESTTCVC